MNERSKELLAYLADVMEHIKAVYKYKALYAQKPNPLYREQLYAAVEALVTVWDYVWQKVLPRYFDGAPQSELSGLELANLRKRIAELETAKEDLELANAEKDNFNEALTRQLRQKTDELHKLQTTQSASPTQLKQYYERQLKSQLQSQQSRFEDEKAALKSQNLLLESQLKQANEKLGFLQSQSASQTQLREYYEGQLKSQLQSQQSRFEDERAALKSQNSRLESQLKQANEKLGFLQSQSASQTQIIQSQEQFRQRNAQLQRQLDQANEKLAELAQELEKLRSLQPKPEITRFYLPEAADPYFSGDKAAMLKQLDNAASSLEAARAYLRHSAYRSAQAYLGGLDSHVEGLARLRQMAAAKAPDEPEELSEWFTGKYLALFERGMFATILTGIARNIGEQPDFYRPFLELLNKSLTASGFYTRKLLPGAPVRDDDYVDMNALIQKGPDKARDNRIEEIERLPYYIDFVNADGEREKAWHSGKMILYRYEAEGAMVADKTRPC